MALREKAPIVPRSQDLALLTINMRWTMERWGETMGRLFEKCQRVLFYRAKIMLKPIYGIGKTPHLWDVIVLDFIGCEPGSHNF